MEGPNLNQHEIIKFLTLKGGRCTNFELVSNFKGALNHPQHQAEARLKFKDIVNTVAIVGEYQNVKYIELKKEYRDNNLTTSECASPQPSSLSLDSGGSSYSSPLTQNFQPYWRYRLSSSPKVPNVPPVRSPSYDCYGKNQSDDPSSHFGRCVSESTLSQSDIQPPPRTRGRSSGAFNRSVSANPTEKMENLQTMYRKSSYAGDDYLSRRSSINGYPPQPMSLDFNGPVENSDFYFHPLHKMPPESRPNENEISTPERPLRSQWPPSCRRDVNATSSDNSSLSYSRSFSGSHRRSPSHHPIHYSSSNSLDKWNGDRQLPRRTERSPKRAGICSDDILQELEDVPKQYSDTSVSGSYNSIHETANGTEGYCAVRAEDNNYSSLPDYSYRDNHLNKSPYQNSGDHNSAETQSDVTHPKNVHINASKTKNSVKRNLFPSTDHQSTNHNGNSSNDAHVNNASDLGSSSDYERRLGSSELQNGVSGIGTQEASEDRVSQDGGKFLYEEGDTPPAVPERRRKHSKSTADVLKENSPKPIQEELSNSTGKVKDRVQLFDDLEKKMNHHSKRALSSPLPDKENRGSKTSLMEDDVSISVLDPKLKREWFVKAAQGDYYALVGLLKKEPKLAAIKDIASGFTALHWAAKHGNVNIVKLIAGTYKVNPNIRTNGGYTAIHLATLYKHSMIVDLLVHTYGADASIRDYSGKRADQYPANYVRTVAGLKATERRPLKVRPLEKESGVSAFIRIGSLNLRKSRKSAVFASVRGRNWGSATELRLNNYKSTRKKNSKNALPEKKCDNDTKNDSDSDSAYGFNVRTGV